MDRLLDLVADREDRALPRAAEPEVPVVEQEVDAVLLRLDRVVRRAVADDRERFDAELEAAGRARIGADGTGERDRSLRGQLAECLPRLGRHGASNEHGLKHATSVAYDHEGNFAGRAQVRDPAADGDGPVGVIAQFGYTDEGQCHWESESYTVGPPSYPERE